MGLVRVSIFLGLLAVIAARLAPHYLSVGSGIGMPSSVKDKYHSTDTIISSMENLSNSCKYLTRHEIQATEPDSGKVRSNFAYTLTDPDTPKDNKKRFMLTFGMHGREYISSETALYLSQFTCRTMYGEDVAKKSKAAAGVALGSAPDINHPVVAAVQTTHDVKDIAISSPEANAGSMPAMALEEKKPLDLVPGETRPLEQASFLMEDVKVDKAEIAKAPEASAERSDASIHDFLHGHEAIQMALELTAKMDQNRLLDILRKTEIAFIPILNIDGRKKVESGDTCTNQRKNGRNVDINRNFADWFSPTNARPDEEDYQGPHAMSEWESNVVRILAQQFRPHAYIDVHSGDLGMGYVYGHSGSDRSPHDDVNQRWVRAVDDEVFGGKVWRGNLANMGSMPYESHGASCDYLYNTHGAHISGTWEVWKKSSFFASSAADNSYSGSMRLKEDKMTEAASKFDHVDVNVVPIAAVDNKASLPRDLLPNSLIQSALMPELVKENQAIPQDDVMQGLLQSALDSSGNNDALGLTRVDLQSLIQSMEAEGKPVAEIQTLLQDMGREQCFAYFNPIMPDHYDSTVAGFSMAVLVGAEKLHLPEVAQAI